MARFRKSAWIGCMLHRSCSWWSRVSVCAEPIRRYRMTGEIDFDFITDEKLRAALRADYREMTACVANEAWKAVYVLAGSLVEAILVDYLQTSGHNSPDPLKMTLGELITAAKSAGARRKRLSSRLLSRSSET